MGFITLNPHKLGEEAAKLDAFLKAHLIGQRHAIASIVHAYDKFWSPLARENKPLYGGLFLGSSGIGKTYIAQLLARYFYKSASALTVIEGGSYTERHEIAQLVGSPPGFIGYDDPTKEDRNLPLLSQESIDRHGIQYILNYIANHDPEIKRIQESLEWASREVTKLEKDIDSSPSPEKIKEIKSKLKKLKKFCEKKLAEMNEQLYKNIDQRRFYSIILIDEVEKAHPSLHNYLLNVLAEGKTTLRNNETTSFVNSFIILTSNAGSRAIAEILQTGTRIGFRSREERSKASIKKKAEKELKTIFKPEFLNRLERTTLIFNPHSPEHLTEIMNLHLAQLISELEGASIALLVDDAVKDFILKQSIEHPEYGARPIKNRVDTYIREPVGRLINSQQLQANDVLWATIEYGHITFKKSDSPT